MSAVPKSSSATRARLARPARAAKGPASPGYQGKRGAAAFIKAVVDATPLERVEIERQGVSGAFIKEISRKIGVPTVRVFRILGVPRATAEKKAAAGQLVKGSGGQAAVGLIRLLGIADEIAANSTSERIRGFDAARWLGTWIERPQPALGGRRPADLLDTPTGVEVVARLLGSLESGAFQ